MLGGTTSPEAQRLLATAEQALVKGDYAGCLNLCSELLSRDAVNVAAHLMRGVACNQLGELDRAVTDLLFVLEREPANVRAAFTLGQALRKSGHHDAAIGHLKSVLNDPGLRPHGLFEMARALRGLGRTTKAIEHYRLLLQEVPNHADAAANLAALLEKSNQLEDALAWADRSLVLAPNNRAAQLTRARCQRRLGKLDEAIAAFEDLLAQPLAPMTRVIATNQLAQCLDRQGRYPEAFDRFTEANALQIEHDPDYDLDHSGCYGMGMAEFLRDWLRDHPAADWSPTPADDRDPPVFLVGFPRSGTTLLDQVLSAHPRIGVIEEKELFLDVRRRWMALESFPTFHEMSEDDIRMARRLYRAARADALRDPDAQLIVDKLPLNSMYLPLIHRLFPDARVLFALRDPRDACLSSYFQTFKLVGAMPYFLRLDTTAAFYNAVMGQATEALDALPLARHEVRYEDVVQDLEQQARQLVDFLDLPWSDAVLDYRSRQAGRDINTPSYQQVSEPLHERSIGRWRNYAEQLSPVLPVLERWAERFGYPQH